jgi:electron transfer flavoprotein beta subunit
MNHKPNILVLLREVCDPRPPVRLNPDGYSIRERGLRRIANPADLGALEQALTLAEAQNGSVTVVGIGPRRLDDQLRLALSMGATRAIRVWDAAFKGGDASADARLVERIIEVLQPDFFLSGHRLTDRGADPVPALASARRGIPCVTAALSVDCRDGEVLVLRKCDRGARQLVGASVPCTLLFAEGCCEVRYPTQAALLASLDQPIETWGFAELGLPPAAVGSPAALLGKERCSFPRANPQRVVTPDANLPAFERILALLSGGIKPRAGKLHSLSAEQTVEQLLRIFAAEGLLGGGER